jgi:membrane protein YdbS with pleckstrin-like domain
MDSSFESLYPNELLSSLNLPVPEKPASEPIERNWVKSTAIYGAIFGFIMTAGAAVGLYFIPDEPLEWWIYLSVLGPLALIWLLFVIYPFLAWKKIGYLLRQRDITYKKGLIWQSETTVTYNRVQHVEISQGPLQKMFNLASVQFFTAGGDSSDLEISGLSPEKARTLKDFVAKKSSEEE